MQASKFVQEELPNYGIDLEPDIASQATFVFYGLNGTVVEEVVFASMDRPQIRETLRTRGFLPMRQS